MYLKKVTAKNITYLKLVETVWDKTTKKRSQKTIVNLGRLDTLMDNGLPFVLKKLAETVNAEVAKQTGTQGSKYPEMVDINSASESEKLCYGHFVYRKLWHQYQFPHYLELLKHRTQANFDFPRQVYLMTINQLLNPSSKLQLWHTSHQYLGLENIRLHHLYRSLDILAEHKEDIENYLFEKNKNLFNQTIDIVFYDVTTFYFESQKTDELKDFGFDKDNKINNVHIVMGLLIDRSGRPIGYELFEGNTYEGHTLLKSIEKLQKRFQVKTVVIVADKGLNAKMNLKAIRDAGYHYIVSGRLKNMKQEVTENILDFSDYIPAKGDDLSIMEKYEEGAQFFYKVIDYKNQIRYKETPQDKRYKKQELNEKLICTYSSKRAEKDRKDRERLLEKAREIKENNDKSKLDNQKGHKKYLAKIYPDGSQGDNYQIALDNTKIREDEKYDGFYVIQSSNPRLSAKEVIENYHYLYKIEESFRVMKTTMEVRPIHHWTPKRIRGHFVMSFIAFLLERELELRLIKHQLPNAPTQIKKALNSLELNKIQIEGTPYYIKNKHTKLASQIMAKLKIKQPENVLSKQQLENYMKRYYQT